MYFLVSGIFIIWLFLYIGVMGMIGLKLLMNLGSLASFPLGEAIIILVIGLVITWVLSKARLEAKFARLSRFLRKKPSNNNVKDYIDTIDKKSLTNHPVAWAQLREMYNRVIRHDHIDYQLKVELFEILRLKGTNGVYPPRKPEHLYRAEQERKRQEAGEKGEEDVAYALKWLNKNKYKIFNNIKLSAGGEPQEFDTIVVGDKAIFNIETKNFIGNLEIDEEGNWYRINGDEVIGTENVNFQVRRHHKVLDQVLENRLPIVDLIVWTNIKSIIRGAQNSSAKILKVDQLEEFIEEYNPGSTLSQEEIKFAIESIKNSIHK